MWWTLSLEIAHQITQNLSQHWSAIGRRRLACEHADEDKRKKICYSMERTFLLNILLTLTCFIEWCAAIWRHNQVGYSDFLTHHCSSSVFNFPSSFFFFFCIYAWSFYKHIYIYIHVYKYIYAYKVNLILCVCVFKSSYIIRQKINNQYNEKLVVLKVQSIRSEGEILAVERIGDKTVWKINF